MWRMTASIFLKIYSIVDANRWIPLCTKITKKNYFEKKSCFVGRINLPLTDQPSLNLFCIKLFFSCLFIINQNIKKLYLLLFQTEKSKAIGGQNYFLILAQSGCCMVSARSKRKRQFSFLIIG